MAIKKINKILGFDSNEFDIPETFISKNGIEHNVADSVWQLQTNAQAKGGAVDVSWLRNLVIDQSVRFAILETMIFYAEQRSPQTVATINYSLSTTLQGINTIEEFKSILPFLPNSRRKTLSGFFSTGAKLNPDILKEWSDLNSDFIFGSTNSVLDPQKGRLTEYEYDSFLSRLRLRCDRIKSIGIDKCDRKFFETKAAYHHYYFDSKLSFQAVVNVVAFRVLTQLVRRPSQIECMKWCDILPVGSSFSDKQVSREPMMIDSGALHVRIFRMKQNSNELSFRYFPEKSSIYLSEDISNLLYIYKIIYMRGLKMALERDGVNLSESEFSQLVSFLPVFPSFKLLTTELNHRLLEELMHDKSSLFHLGAANMVSCFRLIGVSKSDRFSEAVVTNNRIRHTVLSNAAMNGYSIERISRITEVTVPAARKYIDLGIRERQKINENYLGNEFLKKAFTPISTFSNSDELVGSIEFGVVGIGSERRDCNSCPHKNRLQRPVPCYGCENFLPLLEADHANVLKSVQQKIIFLGTNSLGGIESGAIKRLKKAEKYIRMTIKHCEEVILTKASLKNKGFS